MLDCNFAHTLSGVSTRRHKRQGIRGFAYFTRTNHLGQYWKLAGEDISSSSVWQWFGVANGCAITLLVAKFCGIKWTFLIGTVSFEMSDALLL